MKTLSVVVPVYNDWPAFAMLLRDLDVVAGELPCTVSVLAIDDGSTVGEASLPDGWTPRHLSRVDVVELAVNVGHQRAIAIGLCSALEDETDATLVMDADGEDAPQAIDGLLAAAEGRNFCVVAQRQKRTENLRFRMSYVVYRFMFKAVTGKVIRFGNFSVISRGYLRRLVMIPDLWNNLPAALLRSKLPIRTIPVDRARRYTGHSKMNFTSLVVHGLSGISVYADTIFVRLLLLTLVLSAVTGVAVITVFLLRVFYPAHATPGWATTVSFGMTIIVVQVLSVTLSSILMLLNSRVQQLVIPLRDYRIFIGARRCLAKLQGDGNG